jgi:predicted lactoylglutathione lyase
VVTAPSSNNCWKNWVIKSGWARKGAKIRHPPTNYQWVYEMQIEDLDGNVLRIGSDPKEDQPIGEWFDMHGRSWSR